MQIVKVRELLRYTYEEISAYLDDDSISKLISLNMLRRYTNRDVYDAEDLMHESLSVGMKDTLAFYVFRFVGIITIKEVCLISYPKYIINFHSNYDPSYEVLRELIAVITKYESIAQNQALIENNRETEEFNLLSFTLDLLAEYRRYGLYSNDTEIIERNGQGNILWDKTIAEEPMYISNGDPIYLDYYTEKTDINLGDVVRQLHACILTQATKQVADILSILQLETISLSEKELSDFGDDSYITYRLHQEYTRQFVTRKQELIDKLISYVNKTKNGYVDSDISFVGTTSMNMVWEKVCATVYGDCRKKTLEELSLLHPSKGKLSDTIEDLMPRPLWQHSSGATHEVKDTLILDLIVIHESTVEIYDAKYYNIQLDEYGVKNQPGIGDITKQYLYQKAYAPLAKANQLEIVKNAFLMPTDGKEEVFLGKVSIDLFRDDELRAIETILLPASKMFKAYLDSQSL